MPWSSWRRLIRTNKICRYLLENIDWLEEDLDSYEDEFLILDCPGQIELYTHSPIFKEIVSVYSRHGYNICCVYLLEAAFLQDPAKFFSGVLNAMSAMVQLEIPHINVITKLDMLPLHALESEEVERSLYSVVPSFANVV